MDQQTVTELIALLEQIADNKLLLGDRLVEIGVSGPDLEATLGAIAMAQGELGHARLLYHWSFDLRGHTGKKPDVTEQTGKAFSTVLHISNWIELIANLYVASASADLVIKALLDSRRPEIVNRLQKLWREQQEHLLYSRGWLEQLLQDAGAIPTHTRQALADASQCGSEWLSSIEQQSRQLTAAGILSPTLNLAAPFQLQISQLLQAGQRATHVH
ncbi:Phenylacetic acid catabolic protein [Brevibacillus fulvus]|uniref:1,2-phenylacetyl-CoA epoxidase catalytic subunit n=1 Tax=Brevibacillus fulvus TaxID=1125967 RepID=A0A938Y106_9BACL|nr:1,2-phenylacetyl-CoA epoxidase catalytic subunit [Brevibacillus fulvus]